MVWSSIEMIISSLAKLISYGILASLLTSPRHPSHPILITLEAAEGAEISSIGIHPPGPFLKEWRMNTNFDNVRNWEGLSGYENCSGNIYSFPYDLDNSVVTLPREFIGKQIILPVNAHFVFQEGITTLSGPSSSSSNHQSTCRAREVNFLRTSRADWFHPDNWLRIPLKNENLQGGSLLNAKTVLSSSHGVADVEKVPCQYDSVSFPANSSFNLKISSNVSIQKFYIGNKKQSYTNVAILMNSELGKLQFQKAPETIFSIRDNDGQTPSGEQGSCQRGQDDEVDSDHCICSNYGKDAKQKICALVSCNGESADEDCSSPILPHGFCCPICGFHMKIRHSGALRLDPLYAKLKLEVEKAKVGNLVSGHLTRYQEKSAHLVVVPSTKGKTNESILEQITDIIMKFQSILMADNAVIGVTLTESWERLLPSGASDRLEGSGLGGGLITLIVVLLVVCLLTGLALFIFIWNKKHGYPPMTLPSMTSVLNRMPSMSIPIVQGRRSSTLSSLHTFGFARFTNERVSTVTINRGEEASTGEGSTPAKPAKSSSLRRAEQVDDEPLPMTIEIPEKVTDANSGAFGFSNVTYDLIGVTESSVENIASEETAKPTKTTTLVPPISLQIPEVIVVDVDPEGSTSGYMLIEEKKPTPPPPTTSTKPGGKFSKPITFVTSRMAQAYQKLTPEEELEEEDNSFGETSRKKKGKQSKNKAKPADSNGSEPALSQDQQDHHSQQDQPKEAQQEQDVVQVVDAEIADILGLGVDDTSRKMEE